MERQLPWSQIQIAAVVKDAAEMIQTIDNCARINSPWQTIHSIPHHELEP